MSSLERTDIADNDSLADSSQYMADVSSGLASAVLGLMGFTVALVVGLIAQNPVLVILVRAILAMLVCSVIGRLLGSIGEVCVREFVQQYKSDRPQPNKPQQLIDLDSEIEAHASVVNTMKKAA